MIRLGTSNLAPEVLQELNKLQDQVDAQPSFGEQAATAQKLWKSKGGKAGQLAFVRIKGELQQLCVFVEICNYCEQNEASDIEHIFPKSFFPGNAFVWENYLLACKHCNSTFKLDKIHVIDAHAELVPVLRGSAPASQDVAFINPRIEDPADFMYLNPETYRFEIMPGLPSAQVHKAAATLQILELNERDPLVAARKKAALYFWERLDRLRRILQTPDVHSLQALLNPGDDDFDFTMPLAQLKAEIRDGYQNDIVHHQHPSVWQTIKFVQSKVHPAWMQLFNDLPEALHW